MTSRSSGASRGRAKCSELPTEIRPAVVRATGKRAQGPCAALRLDAAVREAKDGAAITPTSDALVPPLIEPASPDPLMK